ncbi:MAG: hypothetical protein E6471_02735, partial [Bradyrhizobium sp.]|nr:hypothetical protein [Bradyrhizobium sp.]
QMSRTGQNLGIFLPPEAKAGRGRNHAGPPSMIWPSARSCSVQFGAMEAGLRLACGHDLGMAELGWFHGCAGDHEFVNVSAAE